MAESAIDAAPGAPVTTRRRPRRTRSILASVALLFVLLVAWAGFVAAGPMDYPSPATGQALPAPAEDGVDFGGSATGLNVAPATVADESQSVGVVLIDVVLAYDRAEAAGTGMVVSADGLVLTNNHVIEGATSITATVGTSGRTYRATVLGVNAVDDVALLQLESATGLDTVAIDARGEPRLGDPVTAVGNSRGGGVLMAAEGAITALDATVTASTGGVSDFETLTGTIEISADVVSGDSGGPLLDSDGEVIGMMSAASFGRADVVGYAITIGDAMRIAEQIRAGEESGNIVLGYPAFLGVGLMDPGASLAPIPDGASPSSVTIPGAHIAYVFAGTPAERAGLVPGDTVTAVDDLTITDGESLAAAMAAHEPGDTVTVTWTDGRGTEHSASVVLARGPAA